MRLSRCFAPIVWALCDIIAASAHAAEPGPERLGTVDFANSCAPAQKVAINRGVALLHDFWYAEAMPQFEHVLAADPGCAIARWGIVMSQFHQIWDRPDDELMAKSWATLEPATRARARVSTRERGYIAALATFFHPDDRRYPERIVAYRKAMAKLAHDWPKDVDAGAFHALAMLASTAPGDTSLADNRSALAALKPLWRQHPDHPGVVHYIVHACDTPALAADGLAAARHYGKIAPSGAHAAHMGGHIFARLGLWQEDIAANAASVEATNAAEARGLSGWMDQFHSDDFLVYAYLQRGDVSRARAAADAAAAAITRYSQDMDAMPDHWMYGMFPYYQAKLPIFLALETRDWVAAESVPVDEAAPPQTQEQVWWAHGVAAGHRKDAEATAAALAGFDATLAALRATPNAYMAEGSHTRIDHDVLAAWSAYAEGDLPKALALFQGAAELQDRVGQREVDIPVHEMIGDLLFDSGRPGDALVEYDAALVHSPGRFRSLSAGGQAAEAAGKPDRARELYAALLASVDPVATAQHPAVLHARAFVAEKTARSDTVR